MKKPPSTIDIFLQPGEFYFGDRHTCIRTVLGSCVSITMWHPKLLIGGMCHYMLPYRGRGKVNPRTHALDGRYADEAILMFFREAARAGTSPRDYEVKVFGGGNMFPQLQKRGSCRHGASKGEIEACPDVSCKNASVVHSLASVYGFSIAAQHTGGVGHRQVLFEVWSGNVWVKQVSPIRQGETA